MHSKPHFDTTLGRFILGIFTSYRSENGSVVKIRMFIEAQRRN